MNAVGAHRRPSRLSEGGNLLGSARIETTQYLPQLNYALSFFYLLIF